jgi:AcrR family transcriptional regulator
MNNMEHNKDKRVIRTKALLIRSISALMKQKNIKDITVKELCEYADINRGTFYLHYKDIYDMLDSIEQELSDKFLQIFQKYNSETNEDFPYPLFLEIFKLVDDNAELFRVLIGPNGDISFIMKIFKLYNIHCLQSEFNKLSPQFSMNQVYYSNFILYGCVGLLEQWLSRDTKESPEKMAELITKLVSTGVLSLFNMSDD